MVLKERCTFTQDPSMDYMYIKPALKLPLTPTPKTNNTIQYDTPSAYTGVPLKPTSLEDSVEDLLKFIGINLHVLSCNAPEVLLQAALLCLLLLCRLCPLLQKKQNKERVNNWILIHGFSSAVGYPRMNTVIMKLIYIQTLFMSQIIFKI